MAEKREERGEEEVGGGGQEGQREGGGGSGGGSGGARQGGWVRASVHPGALQPRVHPLVSKKETEDAVRSPSAFGFSPFSSSLLPSLLPPVPLPPPSL